MLLGDAKQAINRQIRPPSPLNILAGTQTEHWSCRCVSSHVHEQPRLNVWLCQKDLAPEGFTEASGPETMTFAPIRDCPQKVARIFYGQAALANHTIS